MFGSFYCVSGKSFWFKLEGKFFSAALPVAFVENLSDTDIQYEIESARTKGGALTSVMLATTVGKNGGMHRTDIPKSAGADHALNVWQKITVTGAKNGLNVRISLHGVGVRLSGSPEEE